MDSSRRTADARKRALWDEAHARPQRDSSRRHVVRPWRSLTRAERDAVEAAWDDLLDVACEARQSGWREWERDPAVAAVRSLGLVIWPAALNRLARQARAELG